MNYLAIVPARAGSKRIPGKNLALLAGRPLLAYTADAVRDSRKLDMALISTDAEEIATQAKAMGLQHHGLRPAEIAHDGSPTLDAVRHALANHEFHGGPAVDAVVILQPTSPFRTARHIDEALSLFEAAAADTLVSVRQAHDHPYWTWRREGDAIKPFFSAREMATDRNALPESLVENGAIFVARRELIVAGTLYGDRIVPYMMDEFSSIDIDTPDDLACAELMLSRRTESGA